MSEVTLRGVTAGYGSEPVLSEVDLTVHESTITAVLGGSGSGKTTLLRVIAGFLRPHSGTVAVGGTTVAGGGAWVPPERRGVAYVRQDGALFPHLSVAGNIAFGLPRPRRRHRERILELLELVDLPASMADRRPDQLSGGQQQRVALARALAPRPALVLLDEPFSSLDAALRAATREATAHALKGAGATAILVTHDQEEALSMADEVAILAAGRFRQVGRPEVVYREPVDTGIATFLGDTVLLPGTAAGGHVDCGLGRLPVAGARPEGPVEVMVRPEQIVLTAAAGAPAAIVHDVTYFGHDCLVELVLADDPAAGRFQARVLGPQAPVPGDRVTVSVQGAVRTFPLPGRMDRSGSMLHI